MSLSLTGTTPSFGTFQSAYTQTFTASGGTSPYTFTVSAGALPTGLALGSSTGIVSGFPEVAATYSFTILVTDSLSATASFPAVISIDGAGWVFIEEPTIGLTDRSNYLLNSEAGPHAWSLELRKRGQAQVTFYVPAGDDYVPTRGCPIYLCDVTSAGSFVPTVPNYVYSTAGVGKALMVASGGTIPSGWENTGFDDSAWTAPVQETGATVGGAFTGSQWITADNVASGIDGCTMLYRIPFTVTVAASASISFWADNQTTEVWINNTSVWTGAGVEDPAGSPGGYHNVTVSASLLSSGSNLLSIQTLNGIDWTSMCFALSIDETVTTSPVPGAVWSGLIQNFEYQWLGTAGDKYVTMTAVSFESVFDTVYCSPRQYVDQTCGDIVLDLLNYFETGCNVSAGTISAGATIPLFNTNYEKVSEVFDKLATTSQFTWGVDPRTLLLFFQDPTTIPAPFTLANDQVLWETAKWGINGADYRNRQAVKLSYDAFSPSIETFAGAGQTDFTLMRPVQQVTNAWATLSTNNTATGSFTSNPSGGETATIGIAAGTWQANHLYAVGGFLVVAGFVQKVTTVGGPSLSGSSEPTFLTVTGDTTTDNDIIWTCQGPVGLSTGFDTYTFVATLDNTQFGQVLIGTTDVETCQNLCDAINANASVRGTTFSLPTWECSQCNAIANTGTSFTLQQKAPGTGYVSSLSSVASGSFTWSSTVTSGGTSPQGSLGPNEGATIDLAVFVRGTLNSAPSIQYQVGSADVSLATPANVGSNIVVQYTRADGNIIECERTDLVTALAEVTHGTGKYQQITDTTSQGLISTTSGAGLLLAQTALESFSTTPQNFDFKTYVPGLIPGMTLTVDLTLPTGGTTTLNGDWIIESVEAKVVPVNPYLGIYGHYLYTIKTVDIQEIGSYLDFWQGMGGASEGGSGDGSAVTSANGGALNTTGQPTLKLQTNGTTNADQAVLNLVEGTNVTISDDGTGDITISSVGLLTTKGDLLTYSTTDVRLPVGADGKVLTAKSSATDGIEWDVVPTATTSSLGLVQPDGTTIDISTGVISVPTATTSLLGLVKPDGATIDVASGVISVPTASPTQLGLVKVDGTTITTSGGIISASGVISNPMLAEGDLIVGGSLGAPERLFIPTGSNAIRGATVFADTVLTDSSYTMTFPAGTLPGDFCIVWCSSVYQGQLAFIPFGWSQFDIQASEGFAIWKSLTSGDFSGGSGSVSMLLYGASAMCVGIVSFVGSIGTVRSIVPWAPSGPGPYINGATAVGGDTAIYFGGSHGGTTGSTMSINKGTVWATDSGNYASGIIASYTVLSAGTDDVTWDWTGGNNAQYLMTIIIEPDTPPINGLVLTSDTTAPFDVSWKSPTIGTVTSIALTMPAEFTVSGSPISGSGTIAVTKASESGNTVYAGPSSGSGTPTFRALVAGDLPVATTSALGAVKPDGTTIDVSTGVISVPTATTSLLGLVKPDGATIDISTGVISVPTATTSLLGLVKPDGTTIDVTTGVISVPTASPTQLGVVKVDNSSITISGGVISAVSAVSSLTTNNTSGAATLTTGVLNVPNYTYTGGGVGIGVTYTTSWSAQTSVTVTHGLNTKNVIVQVFDASGNLVTPLTTTITSAAVVTLAFGAAFTGSVVVLGMAVSSYTASFVSQTSVTVTHNMATDSVLVQVVDVSGNVVIPENIAVTSTNVVTLTFGASFSGSVVVIGTVVRSYSTTFSSVTSVTVTHNLGTTAVIVQAVDGSGNVFIPQNIAITSSSVATLTFGASFSGSVLVLG